MFTLISYFFHSLASFYLVLSFNVIMCGLWYLVKKRISFFGNTLWITFTTPAGLYDVEVISFIKYTFNYYYMPSVSSKLGTDIIFSFN